MNGVTVQAKHVVPAWDRVMHSIGVLSISNIPDKYDRYLLDNGIRNRIPSSAGRAVKTIEAFMLQWLHAPDARQMLTKRLNADKNLNGVYLMVGKRKKDGSVNVSLATCKGFVVVSFTADQFIA